MRDWVFPTILIGFQMAAVIVYAGEGNWRKAIYFLAASALIAVITF